MKKMTSVIFILMLALLALPFSAMAKQSYDFSDIEQPFLTLPFEVVSVDVSGDIPLLYHNYHLADSYDSVVKKISTMYDKKTQISDYHIIGITKQEGQEYQVVIAYQNEHNYVTIKPEGSGTLFSVKAAPVSYVTGVFPVAIYGFTMPDGNAVSAEIMTEE